MLKTNSDIAKLKGLGPKSAAMLAQIGITTADNLLQHDAFLIYARLKQLNPSISLNMLYALLGAQQDCDWRVIASTQKTQILMRLDDMGLAP